MSSICAYIVQHLLFQKKEEAYEIQRISNEFFRSLPQKKCILMYFGVNQIASKCFLKMMFVTSEIISLFLASKNHESKIVQTPGGVARENSPKNIIR